MPAGKYNITIEQGAKFERVITVHDRNLTGYEARMHIRWRQSDLDPPLVADIYRIMAQIASGQAARVFVALEDEIARQNEAAKAEAENDRT